MSSEETITITFCDCAENHVGMEKIGKMVKKGFTLNDLIKIRKIFRRMGAECELVDLCELVDDNQNLEPDSILIIRGGIGYLLADGQYDEQLIDDLYNELSALEWDMKAKMYGRVVNKNARHNLCFANINREPDYESGRGTIIRFRDLPLLNKLRRCLTKITGVNLVAEGNRYYDISKCGIGFHGDSERRQVIGARLGATIPLVYQWFYKSEPIGLMKKLYVNHGDLYIMSDKATGNDWKQKNKPTLRHAAGCKKYLQIKRKIKNV